MSEHDRDGGGLKGVVDKAQDMIGGMVGLASASTAGSRDSRAFVANAAVGDLYEVEAGRIALQRSRLDPVRAFAEMMVEHHTTSMHQMASALMSSEVKGPLPDLAAPTALDERRQGMVAHLRNARDEDFDARYLEQQQMAHQETATLLGGYADHGDNPQLRSVARGGLPMVERHLRALKTIARH